MKKKLGMFMMTAGMVVWLGACGGAKSSDAAAGTWNLTKGYVGDQEVDMAKLQAAGIGGTTFEFANGTVRITVTGSDEVSEGTYTVEGNQVTISSVEDGISYTGTLKDDELTITGTSSEEENETLKDVSKEQDASEEKDAPTESDAPAAEDEQKTIKLVFSRK